MVEQKTLKIGNVEFGNEKPFVLIGGPCQMQSKEHSLFLAQELHKITKELGIGFVFKASFDKANRTSVGAKRGIGLEKSLQVFSDIKDKFSCPVITDVHEASQCEAIAEIVDIIQIPAFLCRQTDLLLAAGETQKAINVKKGQFLAPWDMVNVVKKIETTGNNKILLTERGATFGYNNLVTDMRSLPIMANTGYPVVFDATHSVQQPGGQGTSTGGQRQFAPVLANAAVAVGVSAVFIETHEDPDNSPSDGPNMIPLDEMKKTLEKLKALDNISKEPNKG